MFKQEMAEAKSAPPLVFDLALVKAARWHSYYIIANTQVHKEEEGKEGFTAKNPMERCILAGFKGNMFGENVGRDGREAWYCHCAYVIDWGPGGSGGMQPGRGHRHNILNPEFRRAGVGCVPWPGAKNFACTHELGACEGRMLGGVVFNDWKKTRFYEPGEGVGGVRISTGKAKTKSWKSGAYAIELPEKDAKLTVQLEGEKYAIFLPDGKDNVKFDVIVSDLPVFKKAGKLLTAAKRAPETNKNVRFVALVDLYMATQGVLVEAAALDEITALVEQVHKDLDKDMAAVREAVGSDTPEKSLKDVQAIARKYAHTKAQSWFSDATACAKINATYLRMKAMREGDRPMPSTALDRAAKDQQKKFTKVSVPEWRKLGTDLMEKTAALADKGR